MSWTYFACGQSFVGLAALQAHQAQCPACQKRLGLERLALDSGLHQTADGFVCVIHPDRATSCAG